MKAGHQKIWRSYPALEGTENQGGSLALEHCSLHYMMFLFDLKETSY